MGICLSAEEVKARNLSKKIDQELKMEADKKFRQKLLLLGNKKIFKN